MMQVAGLVLAFGLVIGLAWAAARLLGGRWAGQGPGRLLRVLATLPLGRDRSLLLVEVAGQVYLLGAGAGGVRLVARIRDPVVPAPLHSGGGPGSGEPFAQLFRRLLSGQPFPAPPGGEGEDSHRRGPQEIRGDDR